MKREASDGLRLEGTRAFYRRMGFAPLRELGLREWNDASALMLARAGRRVIHLVRAGRCRI